MCVYIQYIYNYIYFVIIKQVAIILNGNIRVIAMYSEYINIFYSFFFFINVFCKSSKKKIIKIYV